MRVNLQALMMDMRPTTDEQGREMRLQAEAGAGKCPEGFVAAESELMDEFVTRAKVIEQNGAFA